ncbi:11457_t:CDS:1, partial [Dentiscutata heterogama]
MILTGGTINVTTILTRWNIPVCVTSTVPLASGTCNDRGLCKKGIEVEKDEHKKLLL